jgi:hypothetical protein
MRSRTVEGVMLKPTEPSGCEFQVGAYDYHVRKEGHSWVLEQFQAHIKDADEAHVRTTECTSLLDAVQYAVEEQR